MTGGSLRYSFGPVPSRRLGQSLGINNIPAKVCSYACVYCQVGRTTRLQAEPAVFYEPLRICRDVRARLAQARKTAEPVDFLTFVPDGEPTLDRNLGDEIKLLKALGVPVAVITNATMLGAAGVADKLRRANWVSLKIDAVHAAVWRKINRPHKALQLSRVLESMLEFSRDFPGTLATETMLVGGLNDSEVHVREIANFLGRLNPAVAYLSVPTRPPVEKWVQVPDQARINHAYQRFSEQVGRVELLIGYEGDQFAATGDVGSDILNITAVHPLRKGALKLLLSRRGASWQLVEALVARGELGVTEYRGHEYYLRRPKPLRPQGGS
jgi:wyosine [tRNA(Phe)-imidazoG37] synthetase (radical SAM superfamily)